MIIIYGTHVLKDDFSRLFFLFITILIFWVVIGLKGQEMTQTDKKLCLSHSISGFSKFFEGDFLQRDENLRRSDFDNLNLFQS